MFLFHRFDHKDMFLFHRFDHKDMFLFHRFDHKDQRWPLIRSAGVGSGGIMCFFRTLSQNFVKKWTRIRSQFLFLSVAEICDVFTNDTG